MKYEDVHKKIRIAYTEKEDGNIDEKFSTKSELKENRKKVFKEFGVKPGDVIEARQAHGTLILPLNSENTIMWRGKNITGVDGFVTNIKEPVIMLRLADCVPLVIYDTENHAMGVFHVGWRGAAKDFHLLGLEKLTEMYETNPRKSIAWVGPSAQNCCFVSSEKPAQSTDPEWKPFIKKKKNQWYVDIPGYLAFGLGKAGIYKKNLHLSSDCTVDSDNLFSYQQSKNTKETEGRFGVLVQLN